ncbi:hypothetical protein [Myceligenerans indicum]|uniref:CBS domain-containing protein n=1 Tax=Myceligenerans indicum TaxID=2593663 RepID=A0ABS1LFA5_9MICO|nr:hypothetical protein [Myceligenerans indicum]MBL0884935.1 CBS domain-containing protein [Myceligenerans indicum]
MHVSEIAVTLPLLPRTSSITDAFRLIAEHDLVAVVITGNHDGVEAVVSSLEVTRQVLPGYVVDDPTLAHLLDDTALSDLFADADSRTLGDAIDSGDLGVRGVPEIESEATLLETASLMVAEKTQILRLSGEGITHRFVLLPAVLDALIARAADGGVA